VTPLKQQELQSLVRIGFIDCTTIRSHRPQRNQRWFYNSYYKHHGWKQLTVQLPDGLTGHSYGPATIDGRVTAESGLNHEMTNLCFRNGRWEYFIYGDWAFGIHPWLGPLEGCDFAVTLRGETQLFGLHLFQQRAVLFCLVGHQLSLFSSSSFKSFWPSTTAC